MSAATADDTSRYRGEYDSDRGVVNIEASDQIPKPGEPRDTGVDPSINRVPSGRPESTRVIRWETVSSPAGGDCSIDIATGQAQCAAPANSCSGSPVVTDLATGEVRNTETAGEDMQAVIRYEVDLADPNYYRSLGVTCVSTAQLASMGGQGQIPIVVTVSDFDSMAVDPLSFIAGPTELDWLPVNMDVVLYAESSEQQLETTLLGTPVAVRAIPVSYTWDLGNGDVWTTDYAGRPYPNHTIAGQYTKRGWYDITLTTTFRGEFSVNGGRWQAIDGTITRQSEPRALYARSMRTLLVAEETDASWRDWQPPARAPGTEGPKG